MLVTENCCRFVIFSWLVIIRCIFLSIKKITVKIFPYISLWCFWLFQNQTFQDRQCAAMNTVNTCSINCGRKKTKYTLSNRGEMIIMRLIIMSSGYYCCWALQMVTIFGGRNTLQKWIWFLHIGCDEAVHCPSVLGLTPSIWCSSALTVKHIHCFLLFTGASLLDISKQCKFVI